MKYGIGLLASAVPTARAAAGCPISRAIHPYGLTWPRGISRVFRSTACENGVRPRRSNCIRRLPCSWSSILDARPAGGSACTNRRPMSSRNHCSNSADDLLRIAAETPSRFQATYTGPSTVSNTAYESAIPACARTRSAKPGGAFTSPSRLRSNITVAMVISSQQFQAAMHVGFDRPHGLAKRVGDFGVRQLLHVTQDDRLPVSRRQARDPGGQLVDLRFPHHVLLGTRARVGLAAVQLDEPRPVAPDPVPHNVDRDLVQPRLLFEIPDPFRRIGDQGAVGSQEGILRDLLRVVPVARQGQPERENAVLVISNQALEGAFRNLHHPPEHHLAPSGCKGIGTMMRPLV